MSKSGRRTYILSAADLGRLSFNTWFRQTLTLLKVTKGVPSQDIGRKEKYDPEPDFGRNQSPPGLDTERIYHREHGYL